MEDEVVARMLNAARGVCMRKGYPVDDPEYGSAVGWGVFKAIEDHRDDGGQTAESYGCLLAIRECENVRRLRERNGKCDRAGASRGIGAPPVPTPISLTDFEILSFVAARGKSQACRLLYGNIGGFAYKKFCAKLDEIAMRVKAEPWRLQEQWVGGPEDGDDHNDDGIFSAQRVSYKQWVNGVEDGAPLGTHGIRRRMLKRLDDRDD